MTDPEILSSESLLSAFISAGIDTPEKVVTLLTAGRIQTERNATLIAIDALATEQKEALDVINTKRTALQAKANALTEQIIAAITRTPEQS